MFQPSPYSQRLSAHAAFDHPIPGEWGDGADVVKGVGSAAGAGAAGVKFASVAGGAAAGKGAAAGLATAAGASATVPVAGWIVGGVLAAAAGTVAIVGGIKKGRVNREQALKWARSMKLPMKDAKEVAAFVVKLSKKRKDKAWRKRQKTRLAQKLQAIKRRQRQWKRRPGGQRTLQVLTFGIKRGPERLRNQRRRVEAKLGLIEAVEGTYKRRREARQERRARQLAEQTGAVAPAAAPGSGAVPTWAWLAGGALLLGGVALVYTQRRRNRE